MPRTQEHRAIAIATPLDDDVLLLRSMTAHEQLSRLFTIELDLLSEDHEIKFDDLLGQNCTVRVQQQGGGTRFFNGFISRFVQTTKGGGMALYRATLVPWLWMLTRNADCRIFQEMTVPDIIKQVFRDHGFSDFDDTLQETYRKWVYCVQYRETDFNFVSRLMEQEGIYYYFRHEDGKHVMVLCDSSSKHKAAPGYDKIIYRQPDKVLTDREFIHDWSHEQQVRTGTYVHRDFNFTTPKQSLEAKSKIDRKHAAASFEVYDYPGEYDVVADGEKAAKVRIEELHTQFIQVRGESDSRGISVGSTFRLDRYPRADQCEVDWLVTSTVCRARSDEFESHAAVGDSAPRFLCSFTVMDNKEQFRPARITPKPVIYGPQTAFVVGKSGEEIWTDEHSRVKVQFHWDRDGEANEKSSCWIRVSQAWAGKKWGAIFIPRIGHEVIVEFLEGDPDRPIITGRVYNADTKPPYDLPAHATMSTLKSLTSKGGGGFNEFRFEDKKGEEQVFLHGERNLDIRVKADRFENIGHDRHLVVENKKFEHVKVDRHEKVDNDHVEVIGNDRNLQVKGKEAIEISGSHSNTVGGDVIEIFKAKHHEATTADYYLVADNVAIEGKTNITLYVGDSYIAINADGIKIATTGKIVLQSSDDTSIKSDMNFKTESGMETSVKAGTDLKLEGGVTAEMKSPNTTVKADATLTLKGSASVMIN